MGYVFVDLLWLGYVVKSVLARQILCARSCCHLPGSYALAAGWTHFVVNNDIPP